MGHRPKFYNVKGVSFKKKRKKKLSSVLWDRQGFFKLDTPTKHGRAFLIAPWLWLSGLGKGETQSWDSMEVSWWSWCAGWAPEKAKKCRTFAQGSAPARPELIQSLRAGKASCGLCLPSSFRIKLWANFCFFCMKKMLLKKKNGYGMDLLSCRLERMDWMVT